MELPTHVVNMLLDRLVAHVNQRMIADIPVGDPTRADVVKKGLLQTEKIQKNIQIGITGGDHEDITYTDGIVQLERMPNVAFFPPAREVGGGQAWWRRGVARLEVFLVQGSFSESVAHDVAYAILGRLMSSFEDVDLSGCTDSFGEHAVKMFCFGNSYFESGGPPTQYIFRGKVLWQCLTERP